MEARISSGQGELQELPVLEFSWDTKVNFLSTVKSRKGACDERFECPPNSQNSSPLNAGPKKPSLPEEGNLQNHR